MNRGDSFQFLRFAPLLRPYARRALLCASFEIDRRLFRAGR